VADAAQIPCIYVLAGTNGAGKSSIAGAMFLQEGVEYFNPDEAARLILSTNPGITQVEANSAAWQEGRRLLERAIAERCNFAFETTLGGNTITALLEKALLSGIEVRIKSLPGQTLCWRAVVKRLSIKLAGAGHGVPSALVSEPVW
jgi:predicted ABC-type ATPase